MLNQISNNRYVASRTVVLSCKLGRSLYVELTVFLSLGFINCPNPGISSNTV